MFGYKCGEHKCVIGLMNDASSVRLVSLSTLIESVEQDKDLQKVIDIDPVYAEVYHSYKHWTLNDYFDKRKSTNLIRFDYCPYCGKQIEWGKMKMENKRSVD